MRSRITPVIAAGVVLAVAAGLVLTVAGPALAVTCVTTTPCWEPDPQAAAPYGRLVFYDASGNVVTSGSDLTSLFKYAAATTGPSPSGVNKATLYFAKPDHTQTTANWFTGNPVSASDPFPNNAAPAPITGPGFVNPLVSLASGEGNFSQWMTPLVSTADTSTGYANFWQVRLVTTGNFGLTSQPNYWETDIQVNLTSQPGQTATGTWSVVDPAMTTTTTTLTSPANNSSVTSPGNVSLSATVAPAENGTVQFFKDGVAFGSGHAVTTSNGTATDTDTSPAVGPHTYKAVFTPTGGTLVVGSSSATNTVTVTGQQTATTTTLSANPSTAPQYQPIVLTANESPTAADPGSMQFFDGAASLGTVTTDDGTAGEYKLTVSTLTQGPHTLTATFTSNNNTYATSTSSGVPVTITAPACPGQPVQGASCTDTQTIQVSVGAGSLTITTPYTAANPFVLPAMTLNSAGTLLSSGPVSFPKAGDNPITVQSSLAGDPNWTVSVSATDLVSGSNTINAMGLGLTGGTLLATPPFPGTVTFTDNPAHNPNGGDTNHGLKGGPYTFAQSSGGGNGSAAMFGSLTLLAPTSTQPGTYVGTITFTVA
jgi:Bacterial Ig-like domain (group 3)